MIMTRIDSMLSLQKCGVTQTDHTLEMSQDSLRVGGAKVGGQRARSAWQDGSVPTYIGHTSARAATLS